MTTTETALTLFLFQTFEDFRMTLVEFTTKLNAANDAANAEKVAADALRAELATVKATFIDPAALDALAVTADAITTTLRPV